MKRFLLILEKYTYARIILKVNNPRERQQSEKPNFIKKFHN